MNLIVNTKNASNNCVRCLLRTPRGLGCYISISHLQHQTTLMAALRPTVSHAVESHWPPQLKFPQSKLPPGANRILFVKNLNYQITGEDLYDLFGRYGSIRQIRIGDEQKTKGTAFVVFDDVMDVCLSALTGLVVLIPATFRHRQRMHLNIWTVFTCRSDISSSSIICQPNKMPPPPKPT